MSLTMPSPWKHTITGVYYLRQRVPTDLAKQAKGRTITLVIGGKPRQVKIGDAVKVSLGTKSPTEAKEIFRDTDAALQAIWARLRGGSQRLSHKQVQALSGLLYAAFADAFDEDPGKPERWSNALAMNARAAVGDLTGLKIPRPTDDTRRSMEERFGGLVDAVLSVQGIETDADSRSRLIDAAKDALDQAARLNLAKANGDYSPDPQAGRFPEWTPPEAAIEPSASVTITGLFEEWKAERARLGGSITSARRWAIVVRQFVAYLGHDDARRVSRADIVRWRDELTASGSVSATTFGKVNRAALSAVFSKGVDLLRLTENPVAGLRVPKEKREVLRSPDFTDVEAEAILRAAIAAPDAPGRTQWRMRMAQRWVPWLCAYTGARVSEMTQLRREDVRTEEGIPYLLITPAAGAVKTKKARSVPLHSHLVEQGFLDFVNACDDGPLFYASDSPAERPWEPVSGHLATWVRKTVGISDEGVSPNHGWRHRFKTVADEVDISTKFSDAICGHAPRTEGERYGQRSLKTLAREIAKLPRYDLDTHE